MSAVHCQNDTPEDSIRSIASTPASSHIDAGLTSSSPKEPLHAGFIRAFSLDSEKSE